MPLLLFISIFVFSSGAKAQFLGNGSVGVGSGKVKIVEGLYSHFTSDAVAVVGDKIIDKGSKKPFLQVVEISKAECRASQTRIDGQLGNVQVTIAVPKSDKDENLFWYWTRPEDKACFKLIPLDRSNRLLSIVLGTLSQKSELPGERE